MLTYKQKRHEPGTRDFAIFDDGVYLGDAIAVFYIHGRPTRKHVDVTPLHVPVWQAQPVSESHPLCGNDDPMHVRFEFETRMDAASALRLRRQGWSANQIVGVEDPPEVID